MLCSILYKNNFIILNSNTYKDIVTRDIPQFDKPMSKPLAIPGGPKLHTILCQDNRQIC